MRISLASSFLLATFLCSSCGPSNDMKSMLVPAKQTHTDRKPAPDFELKDSEGRSVRLSDLRGKVVLLNFWATWCQPCAMEIPWFIEFEQQYKNRGLEVVGVSMDEDGWAAVKPYMARHNINYRMLLGNDSVSQLYGGVDSLPTTFVIDRDGRLAAPPYVGLAGKDEYLHEIQNLLTDPQATSALVAPRLFSQSAGAPPNS